MSVPSCHRPPGPFCWPELPFWWPASSFRRLSRASRTPDPYRATPHPVGRRLYLHGVRLHLINVTLHPDLVTLHTIRGARDLHEMTRHPGRVTPYPGGATPHLVGATAHLVRVTAPFGGGRRRSGQISCGFWRGRDILVKGWPLSADRTSTMRQRRPVDWRWGAAERLKRSVLRGRWRDGAEERAALRARVARDSERVRAYPDSRDRRPRSWPWPSR